MIIRNDPLSDNRMDKPVPGSYEWWYFDAVSHDGELSFVIIFYDGNPFSRRYIESLESSKKETASSFPAISVSVYRHGKPLYYSFLEHESESHHIQNNPLLFQIGQDCFQSEQTREHLTYRVTLNQKLDSGHSIKAELLFSSELSNDLNGLKSLLTESAFKSNTEKAHDDYHVWNLIQPRAEVKGQFEIDKRNYLFNGIGYHDHNTGYEPMRESFQEWYWGRIHFKESTFIYYLMFHNDGSNEMRGWLQKNLKDQINNSATETIKEVKSQSLNHKKTSLFGLSSYRKLEFKAPEFDILIQQDQIIDSGPFYKRWISSAELKMKDQPLEKVDGITEYIKPSRIYNRQFWPLVNMRIRYLSENHHWVQGSKILFPWTW